MKVLQALSFVLFFARTLLLAQNAPVLSGPTGSEGEPQASFTDTEGEALNGIENPDTTAVIYSWKLNHKTGRVETVRVDTVLDYFQIQDPVRKKYTSFSTTGNYSQPSVSDIFSERADGREFIFVNNYFPYMKLFDGTQYINTRKPFSRLTYQNGQSNLNKLELLDAFHSQNITPKLNAGFNFTTAKLYG